MLLYDEMINSDERYYSVFIRDDTNGNYVGSLKYNSQKIFNVNIENGYTKDEVLIDFINYLSLYHTMFCIGEFISPSIEV